MPLNILSVCNYLCLLNHSNFDVLLFQIIIQTMLEAARNKLDCLCLGSRVPAANHVELTSVTFH